MFLCVFSFSKLGSMGITMALTQATTLTYTSLSSCPRKRLMNQLVQGRDLTTQLQILLDESSGNRGSFPALEIAGKILKSFTESISVLSCDNNTESSVLCEESPRSSDDIGSENSIDSKKRLGSKIGRGCYKRRKSCESWITVGPTTDDGHAWRKYGQKDIQNKTNPRCYFRCTHKFDQGCKAIKQVQRMEDNHEMYETTYIGVHTCKEIINSPQIIGDSDPWGPCINASESKPAIFSNGNFTSTKVKREQHKEETNANGNFTVKKEQKEDNLGDRKGAFDDKNGDDSIWKNDLAGFGSPEPTVLFSKTESFLDEDVLSLNMDNNSNNSYYYPCGDDCSNSSPDLYLRFEGLGDGDFHFGGCEFS